MRRRDDEPASGRVLARAELVAEPRVEQHLYNGCPTSRYPAADGRYRVRNAEGQFLGLANITGGVLKVEKLFVERN